MNHEAAISSGIENFADILQNRIDKLNNPTVIGLDPLLEYVPETLRSYFWQNCDDPGMASGLAIFEFNRRIIDAVCDIIPAIKPQLAYFEQYGIHGIEALRKTVEYAREKGMIVIADGKRNDIGSTAQAYANSIFGDEKRDDESGIIGLSADGATLNAYLGIDGINPFIKICQEKGKGVFILVRTSNPSAGDLQDLTLSDGRTVYEAMADHVNDWGRGLIGKSGFSSIGAVIGATWPGQAISLRARMPSVMMLVPGYGAQGASASDAVAGFNTDGRGGIVNASRSLMLAWKKQNMEHELFDIACRKEALKMKNELTKALSKNNS